MTIKQQGGIFGRNPTYNEVTVDTKVTTSGLIADEVGIGVTSPTYPFELKSPNNSSETVAGFGNQNIANGLQVTTNGNLDWGFNALNSRSFTVSTNQTERLRVAGTGSGDVTVSTGNLIIGTSGKGIDFSATSGTGTSEIFDDYEEGNWTPTNNGDSTGTVTASGKYTKTGNVVVLNAQVQIDTNFTSSFLGGLPYSVSHASGSPSSVQSAFPIMTGSSSGYAQVRRGESIIRMYATLSTSGGGFSPTTTDGVLRFTITYFTE